MSTHTEQSATQVSFRILHIGSEALTVEIADTDAKRVQGLSGRERLFPAGGMLFVFDADNQAGIWMKDMRFPIDVIWMDAKGSVITVKENASPNSYPEAFFPATFARYVLEVPAGFAAQHGIAEGSKFVL